MSDPTGKGRGLRRAAHTAWRRLGTEVVVIDLRGNVMYGLDDAGGRVWESLGEEGAVSPAREGPQAAAVERFLGELARLGLVEGAAGAETSLPPPPGPSPSPRILWQEAVQRFGGNCGLRPGQGTPCGGKPTWS